MNRNVMLRQRMLVKCFYLLQYFYYKIHFGPIGGRPHRSRSGKRHESPWKSRFRLSAGAGVLYRARCIFCICLWMFHCIHETGEILEGITTLGLYMYSRCHAQTIQTKKKTVSFTLVENPTRELTTRVLKLGEA